MPQQHEQAPLDGEAGMTLGAGEEANRSERMQKLFQDHNRALVEFLAVKLNSESEARDVAQEAYVRLLQLDRPDAGGFLRAYLFRVATNIATDHLRRRAVRERSAPQQSVLFEQLLARPGPERTAIGQQQLDVIKGALIDLPDNCRTAFVLHLFAEHSVRDIADDMHLTQRMIRYYIARGLAHCRMKLDAES
jgi:RNA polymerase sigma-70 factor (ECF subfamily)